MLEIAEWRGDRAVEGARLEIVCTPNKGTGGSNPPLSANYLQISWGHNSVPMRQTDRSYLRRIKT